MLFILRCIFWLSVVYASILSPGVFSHGGSALHASLAAAASTTDLCHRRASECLDDAARLTALLERTADYRDLIANLGGAEARNEEPAAERRHMRDERLAHAP